MVDFGEDENLEEWDSVDERPVDYDHRGGLDKMIRIS
jgi:hypothetical protein